MKVLITSGGTDVPIDPVRSIKNFSGGVTGTFMAIDFMRKGHEVFFFAAKNSIYPHVDKIDLRNFIVFDHWVERAKEWRGFKYDFDTFKSLHQYAKGLEYWCKEFKPDMICLAAAVSDFDVTPYGGKDRPETITLIKAPKVINNVKNWHDSFLVGFKLLVGASDDQLVKASRDQIAAAGSDVVVANNMLDLSTGRKLVVTKDSVTETNSTKQLVEKLYEHFVSSNRFCSSDADTEVVL